MHPDQSHQLPNLSIHTLNGDLTRDIALPEFGWLLGRYERVRPFLSLHPQREGGEGDAEPEAQALAAKEQQHHHLRWEEEPSECSAQLTASLFHQSSRRGFLPFLPVGPDSYIFFTQVYFDTVTYKTVNRYFTSFFFPLMKEI